MKIGYAILFRITLLHDYRTDWGAQDVEIRPAESSFKTMKDYNLLYRQIPGGILIFARILDDNDTLQTSIPDTDGFRLRFDLHAASPYFYNRTNLPLTRSPMEAFSPNRPGFYWTNLNEHNHNPDNTIFDNPLKLLSQNTTDHTVSVDDDGINYMPSAFNIHFDPQVDAFSLEVKHPDGSTAHPTVYISQDEAFSQYQVDLSTLPAAPYLLNVNGGGDQLVFLSDRAFHSRPLGLIDIFHHSGVPAAYQFVQNSGAQIKAGMDYHLWFTTREAHWKYIFTSLAPTNVSKSGATFDPVNAGDTTTESAAALPIREKYEDVTIQLNGNPFKVPNPDGKTLKPVLDAGGSVVQVNAEVYL